MSIKYTYALALHTDLTIRSKGEGRMRMAAEARKVYPWSFGLLRRHTEAALLLSLFIDVHGSF